MNILHYFNKHIHIFLFVHIQLKILKVDKLKGNEADSFTVYVIEWFQTQYGMLPSKKRMKSFINCLLTLLEDEDHPVYSYVLLFAQLCGFETNVTSLPPPTLRDTLSSASYGLPPSTSSQRIIPLPPAAGCFILSVLEEVLEVIQVPSSTCSNFDETSENTTTSGAVVAAPTTTTAATNSRRNSKNVGGRDGSHPKMGIDASSSRLIYGRIDSQDAHKLLQSVLQRDLNLSEVSNGDGSLLRVSMIALESLMQPVNPKLEKKTTSSSSSPTGGSKQSIMCMKFTVLLGIIFAAWNGTTNHDKNKHTTSYATTRVESEEEVDELTLSRLFYSHGLKM
jgi:hypothetical protein